MTSSHNAFQHTNVTAKSVSPGPSVISLEQVSVSQLLGRDYVFISAAAIPNIASNSIQMRYLFNNLVQQLELAETHTVAVTVDEMTSDKPAFIRHDLQWYQHQICRIDSISITQPEQYEFMNMIWHCSTSAIST